MTAPGNTVLIILLLAVFLACTGYAAGRLHQRRQTGHDREEAYRDGYETATRSVFSLAARVIGPRRSAARGSATVKPANGGAATALPADTPPGPEASRARSAARSPSAPAASPAVSPSAPLVSPAAVSAGEHGPPSPRPADDLRELGFPAPPPAPPSVLAEPAAVGGVTYQPFPDPRRGEDPGLVPGQRAAAEDLAAGGSRQVVPGPAGFPATSPSATSTAGTAPSTAGTAPSAIPAGRARATAREQRAHRRAIHRAAEDGPDTAEPAASETDAPDSPGRHTVPDELVRATTYRLPPDRVFRAKVRENPGSPGLPEEPTTRLVPKPRQS